MAKASSAQSDVLPSLETIASQVLVVRAQRVLLGPQLAMLYEVETRALNQAVQRNATRFPSNFVFQLNWDEVENLKSQIVILNEAPDGETEVSRSQSVILKRGKNLKYAAHAFTEQTFVKLRSMLAEHSDLKRKLNTLKKNTMTTSGWCSTPSTT